MKFERLHDLLLEDNKLVGVVGITNNEGTAYLPVRADYLAGHDDIFKNGKGSSAALIHARKHYDDGLSWRYVVASKILYAWGLSLAGEKKEFWLENAIAFLNKMNLEVVKTQNISGSESSYRKSHYYIESFHTGVRSTFHGIDQYAEIFKNPSVKELRDITRNNTAPLGAIITPQDAFMWNRNNSFHFNVRQEIRQHGISAILLCDDNFSKCYVDITDNTRNTEFYHKPCKAIIESNPYMRRFKILGVSYFDEDIVGSWDKMAD